MNNFKAWATNTAYILFDDSKNDLRALAPNSETATVPF